MADTQLGRDDLDPRDQYVHPACTWYLYANVTSWKFVYQFPRPDGTKGTPNPFVSLDAKIRLCEAFDNSLPLGLGLVCEGEELCEEIEDWRLDLSPARVDDPPVPALLGATLTIAEKPLRDLMDCLVASANSKRLIVQLQLRMRERIPDQTFEAGERRFAISWFDFSLCRE